MLYTLLLFAHSYLRWVVLALALIVVAQSLAGFIGRRDWTRADERLHQAFVGVVDLQFTLGAIMYLFMSPISHAFFADVGVGMRQPLLRFFGLEHPLGMLLAVALVHIGRTRSKRAADGRLRHRRVWTFTLAGLLLMAGSIPWPFLHAGRPLLRGAELRLEPAPARTAAATELHGAAGRLQPGAVDPLHRAACGRATC